MPSSGVFKFINRLKKKKKILDVRGRRLIKNKNFFFLYNMNLFLNSGIGLISFFFLILDVFKYKFFHFFFFLIDSNGVYKFLNSTSGLFIGDFIFNSSVQFNSFKNFKLGSFSVLIFLSKFCYISSINGINFFKKNSGVFSKSCGTFSQVLDYVIDIKLFLVKLPSSKIIYLNWCTGCVIGRNGNVNNKKVIFGKAGLLRYFGLKSKVRGVAMNPVDHPHGGRTKTNSPEVSPWGWVAKYKH